MSTQPPIAKVFSQVLARGRRQLGVSQAEMAQRLQVSQTTLSLLERGEREPSLTTARRLAQLLGESLDALAGGPAPAPGSPAATKLLARMGELNEDDLELLVVLGEALAKRRARR